MWRAFVLPIPFRELMARTWREINADNCFGLAAQLAFYFALALFPALIFVVALASYFPRTVMDNVLATLTPVAPAEVVSLIRTQLDAILAAEQGGLLTLGVLGAVWSSSGALTAIIDALNRAYDIEESRPWWKVRLVAILLTIGLALFILVAFTLVVAGPELASGIAGWFGLSQVFAWTWSVVQWPIVVALVAFGVAMTFYFAPDAEQDWVFLTPGSVTATLPLADRVARIPVLCPELRRLHGDLWRARRRGRAAAVALRVGAGAPRRRRAERRDRACVAAGQGARGEASGGAASCGRLHGVEKTGETWLHAGQVRFGTRWSVWGISRRLRFCRRSPMPVATRVWSPWSAATARNGAKSRVAIVSSTPSPTTSTRRASNRSTPSTSRCPTRCTPSTRFGRLAQGSTSCARSRWRSRSTNASR